MDNCYRESADKKPRRTWRYGAKISQSKQAKMVYRRPFKVEQSGDCQLTVLIIFIWNFSGGFWAGVCVFFWVGRGTTWGAFDQQFHYKSKWSCQQKNTGRKKKCAVYLRDGAWRRLDKKWLDICVTSACARGMSLSSTLMVSFRRISSLPLPDSQPSPRVSAIIHVGAWSKDYRTTSAVLPTTAISYSMWKACTPIGLK